ncbi:uncharacterized protein LOC121966820 [Plectropomus leopardus]|uniref:uncharacterized protein LOC121966820 n=1 Tax=Plectropomus leopardus TaxID=160734 RepID=UPI001C4B21F7|nr:uncharacterized protein LOC121966820 [Plectropomus leopardus]
MVPQGTTWKAVPQQRLTVSCPVKHCGQSQDVTWCKLLDTHTCKQINNYTENVEITQSDTHKDELISYLTFTRISIHDGGLYTCQFKGSKYEEISHMINISVSDLHKGVEYFGNNADSSFWMKHSDSNADKLPDVAVQDNVSWLPYFIICISIALVVIILTVFTLLSFYGPKQILTYNHTKGKEMSIHMIPNLPKGNPPSPHVLQGHFSILNDVYSSSTANRPPSQPPLMISGNQLAVENTTDESQGSDHAVYAVISHQRPGIPAKEQHVANKNSQYATINVP